MIMVMATMKTTIKDYYYNMDVNKKKKEKKKMFLFC